MYIFFPDDQCIGAALLLDEAADDSYRMMNANPGKNRIHIQVGTKYADLHAVFEIRKQLFLVSALSCPEDRMQAAQIADQFRHDYGSKAEVWCVTLAANESLDFSPYDKVIFTEKPYRLFRPLDMLFCEPERQLYGLDMADVMSIPAQSKIVQLTSLLLPGDTSPMDAGKALYKQIAALESDEFNLYMTVQLPGEHCGLEDLTECVIDAIEGFKADGGCLKLVNLLFLPCYNFSTFWQLDALICPLSKQQLKGDAR